MSQTGLQESFISNLNNPTDIRDIQSGEKSVLRVMLINALGEILEPGGGSGLPPDGEYGDVTVSGSGLVWIINNGVVTFAKMQDINTDVLLGRTTAGTGSPEEVGVGGGLEISGTEIQRSALTGDVTAPAGVSTTTLADTAVTPGSYTNTSLTVDSKGRITAASSGSAGITGSGTTNTLPLFSGATALGDSTVKQSGTKVSINGAAFLRQFNVYGPVLDARLFFHTDPGGTPGIEMATDTTGTRRALWRMAESGASGTEWQGFTRPAAGGAVVQVITIQADGYIRSLPLAGNTDSRALIASTTGIITAGRVLSQQVDTSTSTYASSTAYNTIVFGSIFRDALFANGNTAHIVGAFTLTNNTGSSQTWSMLCGISGGSTIWEDTIQSLTTSASARYCTVEIDVIRLTTTTLRVIGTVRISQPGTPTAGQGEAGSGTAVVYTFGGTATLPGGNTFINSTNIINFQVANGSSSASHSVTQVVSSTTFA